MKMRGERSEGKNGGEQDTERQTEGENRGRKLSRGSKGKNRIVMEVGWDG